METTLPLEAEALIPHRLPIRMVDRLLQVDGKNGVVEALVSSESPLVCSDGRLDDVVLAELMAQAYAAIKGYCDKLEKIPAKQGFLVGIKKVERLLSAQAGDRLRIKVSTMAELGDFSVAEGEVWRDDDLLAKGEIKVWVQ